MAAMIDVIVSCEHASNAVPDELDRLGLSPDALLDHHAWDAGAGEVAIHLAKHLNAPLFLGKWSRIVADLNRPEDLPQVVPEDSFGLLVPGNRGLTAEQRRARIDRYHRPYWRSVMDEVGRHLETNPDRRLLHLSIHSFTPEYLGVVREVSIGVMFDPDYPLENALGTAIMHRIRERGFVSDINRPYDGRAAALTTSCRHRFPADRYAGLEIEMNQRHLGEIDRIGDLLLDAVRRALAA